VRNPSASSFYLLESVRVLVPEHVGI